MLLEALTLSTTLVAIGEIGDKTQLLSFALARRFRAPWTLLLAILLATLLNHGLSVLLGQWLTQLIPAHWLPWLLGLGFMALGLWMLVPDKQEELDQTLRWGAFVTSFVLFSLAEIGDKTQVATVALAAQFPQQPLAVLAGTTVGMMLANLPVVWLGMQLRNPRWERRIHLACALLCIAVGVAALVTGLRD